MEVDDGQQDRRERWAEQVLQVVGQPREGERPGVVVLFRQDVGDGRLEGRGEGGRTGLEHEDEDVDLPDLVDERQEQGDGGAHEVGRHQEGAARQLPGESVRHRRHQHVGNHLDGQRRAEHRAGLGASEAIGQQPEGNRQQAGADQGNDLRCEKVPVGPVGEDAQHRAPLRGTSPAP